MPKNLFGNFGAFNYHEALQVDASLQIRNTGLATVRSITTLNLLFHYQFGRLRRARNTLFGPFDFRDQFDILIEKNNNR